MSSIIYDFQKESIAKYLLRRGGSGLIEVRTTALQLFKCCLSSYLNIQVFRHNEGLLN